MDNTTIHKEESATIKRSDLYQQVTDTIIQQLEAGTVPWLKPWQGDNAAFRMPKNGTTGNHYQGINILLLWSAIEQKGFASHEWASFKQWQEKKEAVRKGEKGTVIVYYDTLEKQVDGETQKIPFLKSSYVFNRSQLQSFEPVILNRKPFDERLPAVDRFIENTKACIKHEDFRACYSPSNDTIYMPHPEVFLDTATSNRQENYYSTLSHELIHWTGHPNRIIRQKGKRFGDQSYAAEELVAELGAAFLCAELEITSTPKADHASYIAHWLQVLKNDKTIIFKVASEASKAVNYLKDRQPKN